eukprot:5923192-Pleurochrysis_carterae.AAC.1
MPHDATYGTQARLVTALQYTDDMLVAAVGPQAAAAVLVCFTDMIGPCAYLDEDAGEAGRHRGQAVPPFARHARAVADFALCARQADGSCARRPRRGRRLRGQPARGHRAG